jgi:parvulin-like peptidyl-prolyl isomerase
MTAVFQVRDFLLQELRQGTITSEELLALLKQYGMFSQLKREILIDRAIADLALTSEETLQACQQFYQQQQLNSEAEVQAWLGNRGYSREYLDYLTTRPIRLERFKQATWGNKVESYFLQRKGQLDRVIYSLIRVTEVSLAQELFFRIQEGEQSFSELASQYSQGSEAQTGGLIGPVELSVPHPALAKMLAASQPGQLTPPTRLNEWIVIVRLEKYMPAQLEEPVRQRLLNELFESWMQEEIKQE